MPSSFSLTLDTTAPLLLVSGGRDSEDQNLLVLDVDFGDAQELRVWGDIDPAGPENGDYAVKEADAPWFTPEGQLLVRVLAGEPEPKLWIAARDDVWNTATVDRAFPFGPPKPQPSPPPSGGMPRPRRQEEPPPEARLLRRRTLVRLRAHHLTPVARTHARRHLAPISVRSRRRVQRGLPPLRQDMARSVPLHMRRRGLSFAAHGRAGGTTLRVARRGGGVVARTESTDESEAMIALHLLS